MVKSIVRQQGLILDYSWVLSIRSKGFFVIYFYSPCCGSKKKLEWLTDWQQTRSSQFTLLAPRMKVRGIKTVNLVLMES